MRSWRTAVAVAGLTAALAGLTACTSSKNNSSPGGSSAGSTSGSTTSTGDGSTVAATSSDVSFDVDGTKTYGTLETPAHQQGRRLAAALLIPGSGGTDRNGNETSKGVTPNTLRLISDILTKQGIVTLRFDKYFTGKTGAGTFADDPSSVTIQADLNQTEAAYDFLSKQSVVDPAKLLVVGHSEGGMLALNIAASDATKPAGLALLEPQDEPILNLIQVQTYEGIDALAAAGKLTVAEARANGALVAQAIDQFRSGQQVSTTGMSPLVIPLIQSELLNPNVARYVRSWNQIRPVDLAAKVKSGTRVLVTEGTRDTNVPPNTISPLVQALKTAATTGPGLVLEQGTDHFMHLTNQPDTASVLAPSIVTAITQWAQPFAS